MTLQLKRVNRPAVRVTAPHNMDLVLVSHWASELTDAQIATAIDDVERSDEFLFEEAAVLVGGISAMANRPFRIDSGVWSSLITVLAAAAIEEHAFRNYRFDVAPQRLTLEDALRESDPDAYVRLAAALKPKSKF